MSRSFADMLAETIRKYQNRTLEAAQVIAELLELAKKIRDERDKGKDLGLSEDEVAFYDALANNESAVRELGDKTLRAMAKELVVMLRKNTSIDWTIKESVQAKYDELNGLNDFERVADEDLDSFTDYVLQDLEQARNYITMGLGIFILLIILIILIA